MVIIMGSYALIQNGVVVNIVVWDGETEVDFGEDIAAVPYTSENQASIGYAYVDGKFVEPPPTEKDIEEKRKQDVANNLAMKDWLISEGTTNITVWQTKLLIGRKLTTSETKSLNAWLDYLDALDVIDANTEEDIPWPVKPK